MQFWQGLYESSVGRDPQTRTEAGLVVQQLGCIISKLGSECPNHAGSYKWLGVYDEGQGREIVPSSSFVPGEVL